MSEEDVNKITSMGFSKDEALRGLAMSNNNWQDAIQWLLDREEDAKHKAGADAEQHRDRSPRVDRDESRHVARDGVRAAAHRSRSQRKPSGAKDGSRYQRRPNSLSRSRDPRQDVSGRRQGTVTYLHEEKPYGFIKSPGFPNNVFFHFRALTRGSLEPARGDIVSFEASLGDKGWQASNVTVEHIDPDRSHPVVARGRAHNHSKRKFNRSVGDRSDGGRSVHSRDTGKLITGVVSSASPHYGFITAKDGISYFYRVSSYARHKKPCKLNEEVLFRPSEESVIGPVATEIRPLVRCPADHYVQYAEFVGFEDQEREFKSGENTGHLASKIANDCGKYLNAFANTQGGTIYFGIADNGIVHGLQLGRSRGMDARRERDEIRLAVDGRVASFHPGLPSNKWGIDFHEVYPSINAARPIPDVFVIRAWMNPGTTVYTYDNVAYHRLQGSTREMSMNAVRELTEERARHKHEDALATLNAKVDSLMANGKFQRDLQRSLSREATVERHHSEVKRDADYDRERDASRSDPSRLQQQQQQQQQQQERQQKQRRSSRDRSARSSRERSADRGAMEVLDLISSSDDDDPRPKRHDSGSAGARVANDDDRKNENRNIRSVNDGRDDRDAARERDDDDGSVLPEMELKRRAVFDNPQVAAANKLIRQKLTELGFSEDRADRAIHDMNLRVAATADVDTKFGVAVDILIAE